MFFESNDNPLLIAEIGGSHGGDPERLKTIIDSAISVGIKNIKFQIYEPESLVSKIYAPERYKHFSNLELDKEIYKKAIRYCVSKKVSCSLSAWSIDLVNEFQEFCSYLKVGSGDLTFHDLIKTIAKIGKPLILSTGMSKLEEIKEACEVYFDNFIGGKNEAFRNLALLHCVSLYPTDQELVGLNQIEVLKNEFLNNVTIGYSHHCKNHDLIIYSYLLGAKVIEFHYTDNILDDSFRDNQLSLDKNLFTKINQKLEIVKCISKKEFKDIYVAQQSQGNLIDFRRSIYAAKDIKAGEILVSSDFKFLRPLTGIGVEYSKQIFDGTYSLKNDLNSDRSLEWHNIERQ